MPNSGVNTQTAYSDKVELQYSERLALQIREWMHKLIDLSRRNRLLYFRPTYSSTLKVLAPSLDEVFNRLVIEEKPLALIETQNIETERVKRRSNQLLCASEAPLSSVITNLYRHSRTAFEERGIRILHISFGLLSWNEVEKGEMLLSPLILVPVELRRASAAEPFQLYLAEEEVIVNPALKFKLWNDFRFKLEDFEDWEDGGVQRYLTNVDLSARERGWSVMYECWIGLFSFYKLPIYEDLNVHQELIARHPIIQALAGVKRISSIPIDPKTLDQKVDPRQSYLVLDADSSQLTCIELIKEGSNLIIQGPPGTGKSQTIVNLIAEFVSRGKTVLFVSEKMAALEVVYKRLKERGLNYLCLELHSEKTNKKAVVEELYNCLLTRIEPQKTVDENELEKLRIKRDQLNNYVSALHHKYQPLSLSAYQVLGYLSSLHRYPFIPPGLKDPWSISHEYLNKAIELAKRLSLVWNVVAEGDKFPWRGISAASYSMDLRSKIERTLKTCLDTLRQLVESASDFASKLGLPPPNSIRELYWFLQLGELLKKCPGLPEMLLICHDSPFTVLRKIHKDDQRWPFVRIAHEYDQRLISDLNLARLIRIFSSSMRWFDPRFYLGRYRIKQLREDKRRPESLLEDLKLALKLKEALEWRLQFYSLLGDMRLSRQLAELVEIGSRGAPDLSELKDSSESFKFAIAELESYFEAGYPKFYGTSIRQLTFQAMIECLHKLLNSLDLLRDWIDYKNLQFEFSKMGLCELFRGLQVSSLNPAETPFIVKKSLLQAWVDALFLKVPVLGQFRGLQHEQLIAEFRELDRLHWTTGPYRVIQYANKNVPFALTIPESESYILRREALKKKRHLPLRKLFPQIANLLLRMKPCFMMSPLSVSSFLYPEIFRFDLVIFDEASQVRTEDAVGAIYRGKQVVICGDDKQLPPTPFFERYASEEFLDESEEVFEEFESILNALSAAGIHQEMLRWHYRSKHESLIAFSNHQFYSNKLVTFPSAQNNPTLGVEFVYVPDGIYDRGGRRDNKEEAKKVVELIKRHFAEQPNKSLGVVTFSLPQAMTIEDYVEQMRREHPELEHFFSEDRLEGFFVKNLENVQGDERDVLIFSVGYGRDQHGRLTMHFGPLNFEGGHRRLNVAITRAREKVYVVSSIKASDFDLQSVNAPGVLQLYNYLRYAEHGPSILYSSQQSLGSHESPLEEEVASEITKLGYRVVPQVGCSGYRIDLGVLNPEKPGEFILGVECDGATYHSAYTARDRDRLRQEVLEKLGWRIHRVWAPDFATRRETEIQRLREAIESARKASHTTAQETPNKVEREIVQKVTLTEPSFIETDSAKALTTLYRAYVPAGLPTRVYDLFEYDSHNLLPQLIEKIVDVEGPIHIDIVIRRLAEALQIRRVGSRMKGKVRYICRKLSYSSGLRVKNGFLWFEKPNFRLTIRRPDPKDPRTMRELKHIPQEEIILAFLSILKEALSLPSESLITQVGKTFGFQRITSRNKAFLERVLSKLLEDGVIVDKGGRLSIASIQDTDFEGGLKSLTS